MNLRTLFPASLLALLVVAWPAARPRYMSVSEVRPGMVGIGRTAFEGDRVDEFKVHVLGVLRNTNGPRRDLVLARLEGGPLANTGVIAGMSGSPVYIDGRLLGAVSFSLGQFSKEPIAGITPIEEMIESAGPRAPRVSLDARPRLGIPPTRETMMMALREALSRLREPFAGSPGDVRMEGIGAADESWAAHLGVMLRPIATPLALGGFSGPVRDTVSTAFSESGFVPMDSREPSRRPVAGGRQGSPALKPGDPVGVNLITGDFMMGATGTVTEVDGNQVYAFGHPFYNLGTTEFPMTRAYVYTVLPSLAASMKIATTGETIGTFRQDRATAIAGTLGAGPELVPVRLSLETERGLEKTFSLEIVNDQLFTPLLTYVSILNTLSSYEREYGATTFAVKGRAKVRGHGEVAFDDVFAADSPAVNAAASVVTPLMALLGNDAEEVKIDGIDLQISTSERPRTATLERAWFDAVKFKAGTTVPLKILIRTYRGEELTRTVPVEIPANASGSVSVLVSDGARLAQFEQRDASAPRAKSVDQLVRLMNKAKKNNRLYVRLLRPDEGAVIAGETLSSLPPAVLAVMESDRSGSGYSSLRNATAGEWEVPLDTAVSGSRILTITIEGN